MKIQVQQSGRQPGRAENDEYLLSIHAVLNFSSARIPQKQQRPAAITAP